MRCCTCLKRKHKLNEMSFISGPDAGPFPILSAHRGGSGEGTENTLYAFRHAIDQGMNLMELDVHLSKDGLPVVVHDADLSRQCGEEYRGKTISQYNFADLPPMQKEITMHLSPGAYKVKDEEDGKFTLLEELFKDCPAHILYSIDMKDRDDELVRKVNELVVRYNKEDKVIWGSMFKEQHEAVMQINQNVSIFYSGSTAIKTYLCWLFGCLFCCPLKGDVLMTTHMSLRQASRMKEMLVRRGRGACCSSFVLCLLRCLHFASPGLLRHVKKRGNATVVFIANDDEDFSELKDHFGDSLDGLMTDYPSNLANWAKR